MMDSSDKAYSALPPRPRSLSRTRNKGSNSSHHHGGSITSVTGSMNTDSSWESKSLQRSVPPRSYVEIPPKDTLGFDSIEVTPKKRGRDTEACRRSRSRDGRRSASKSKRKSKRSSDSNNNRKIRVSSRSRSQNKKRSIQHNVDENQNDINIQQSRSTRKSRERPLRSKSRSRSRHDRKNKPIRSRHNSEEGNFPNNNLDENRQRIRSRSQSSIPKIPDITTSQSAHRSHVRSRSQSSTPKILSSDIPTSQSASRSHVRSRSQGSIPKIPSSDIARSRSQSRVKSIQRSRSHSRGSRASFRSDESSIALSLVQPNIHHNSIQTSEIIGGPVIAEMKENELYARKAGINFTREGGDYLTFVEDIDDRHRIQDESHLSNLQLNQSHKLTASFDDNLPANASFLRGDDKSNQMIQSDQDLANLRFLAGQLCIDWRGNKFVAPALARRLKDFQFAQHKRRKKFGNMRPWGILGLYDHLSAVRLDVKWAEDAAYRRANGEPYKAWFEFVGDKKTGNNRPFFTYFVMSLCTCFLIASIAANGWSTEPFSVNPMLGPSAETLVSLGAKDSMLIVQENEVWRLISAMVLHAGLIHYLLNMFALWFIGSAVEYCHGTASSILLFVAPAIGGTILSAIFLPNYISVGASGGIFGLIGACLADIVLNWGILFNDFVNENNKNRHALVLLVLVIDIVVNVLIGLTPMVDNFTHLGGMIFGFLCGTSTMKRVSTEIFGDENKRTCWTITKRQVRRFFGIILTVAGLTISLTLLLSGDGVTTPCNSCRALSCMPFPPWADYSDKWWYCDDCGAVSADARIDPATSRFDQITINCPGGTKIVTPLDTDMSTEKAWLENNLPSLCREKCPHVDY